MSRRLGAKYHGRKLMGFLQGRRGSKQLHDAPKLRLVAHSHILHLHKHGCVLYDTAYDFVGHVHNLPRGRVAPGKPSDQRLPDPFVFHAQLLLPMVCFFGKRSGNIKFALMYQLQKLFCRLGGYGFQLRADLRRAALKILHKILQICDQVALVYDKILRLHIFFSAWPVKFSEIVLITLTEP